MTEIKECVRCRKSKNIPLEISVGKNQCKQCRYDIQVDHINTIPKRYFLLLLNSAKSHTKKRKGDASICSVDVEFILKLHEKQNGRCYYSGIEYRLTMKSEWQCSLERLNPKLGYKPGNIALIVRELNGSSQWSLDKIKYFQVYSNKEHTHQTIDFHPTSIRKTYQNTERKIIDGVEHIKCNKCKTFKHTTFFLNNEDVTKGCTPCRSECNKLNSTKPRSCVQWLVRGMRSSTKHRNKKGRNHESCEYTFDDILRLWESQGGLCAYSGIPMTFGSYEDKWWTCSAERIDNTKGYVKGNVCLICYEFNTHQQWSKGKIEYFKSQVSSNQIV